MSSDIPKQQAEESAVFRSRGGMVVGVAVVLVCVVVLVLAVVEPDAGIADWVICLAIGVAVLAWAAAISPVVALDPPVLRLRNVFSVVDLPLRLVDEVSVRQFVAVSCGGERYTNGAVGRSRHQLRRVDTQRGDVIEAGSYGAFAELRMRQAVEFAHATTAPEGAPLRVTRHWRWPEIAGVAVPLVLAVLFAVV